MTKIITTTTNSKIASVGLDLAKNSFSLHAFDEAGNTVLAKDLKRGQVLSFFEKLEPCRVELEACASAHHWNYGATSINFPPMG
jgi:transposase